MQALFLLILSIFFIHSSSFAVRESRPTASDSRIRVMTYSPSDVFKFVGYYGYQTSLELEQGEEVVSISMGDTTAWQIIPAGHRLFMKPIEENATTNMTLITNKRTYFFELYAEEAYSIRSPDMAFNVKFIYPDAKENNNNYANRAKKGLGGSPNLDRPEKLNFNYSISGDEEIAPIKIFDDGEFTYMQFRDRNNDIPSIFMVDDDLREIMVNFRLDPVQKNLIIVERVWNKFSLKVGKKIVCIFNEMYRSID